MGDKWIESFSRIFCPLSKERMVCSIRNRVTVVAEVTCVPQDEAVNQPSKVYPDLVGVKRVP